MDYQNLLKTYMDKEGRILIYPSKRKLKNVVLFYLSTKFTFNIQYTEKQVNEIIDTYCLFNDSALIRRELYMNKFLNRHIDGSAYWLEEIQPCAEKFGL